MKKRLRRSLALCLVKSFMLLARILPRRIGHGLFAFFGTAAHRLYRGDRERAVRNISMAFPEGDRLIADALARGSFAVLGRNAFDAMRLARLSGEELMRLCRIDGEENLRIPYERGRGVIALTGHIGCWELMGAYFSAKGYRVSVIARELRDSRLNAMLVALRQRHGIASIPRGTGAVAGFRVLRRGEMLGMLIDQDIDVEGVFVPFFGRPAHTPSGVAVFSLRSGAPVVPMGIHLQPGGWHRITVLPELDMPPGSLSEEERVYELTRRASEAVERLIRIYPQQWVWFHDRWRRRPETGDATGAVRPVHEERAGLY